MDFTIRKNTDDCCVARTVFLFSAMLAVFSVLVAVGIKFCSGSDLLSGHLFYNRYDGTLPITDKSSLASAFRYSLELASPCLVQIISLYVLSYSPFLLPAGFVITGIRGIIVGASICVASGARSIVQVIFYIFTTVVICFTCTAFAAYSRKIIRTPESIAKKTLLFFIASGIPVIGEFVLSLII